MSALEDLEEIAEQTAFGNGDLNSHGARGHRPRNSHCGAGHAMTPENTRTYKQDNRWRFVCRTCDKHRAARKRRVKYSAREYPL